MRIRCKPWARQELETSDFYIDNPEDYKGKWKTAFKNEAPIYIELGCGKGNFIANLAVKSKNINFIAIDIVDAMLGIAKRTVEQKYKEENEEIDNLYLTRFDIERIPLIMDKNDKIERIYINFCNPWPRGRHRKRRLTHRIQLEKYKEFLVDGGEIRFKTDDDNLFEDTLIYLRDTNFKIIKYTYDLENENDFWDNIQTEHEKMFIDKGIKIKALIAVL